MTKNNIARELIDLLELYIDDNCYIRDCYTDMILRHNGKMLVYFDNENLSIKDNTKYEYFEIVNVELIMDLIYCSISRIIHSNEYVVSLPVKNNDKYFIILKTIDGNIIYSKLFKNRSLCCIDLIYQLSEKECNLYSLDKGE